MLLHSRQLRSIFPALLLTLLAAALAATVSAARVPPPDEPALPQVVRIYYDEIADLAALSAYDLFEANNLDERYVMGAVSDHELQALIATGWRVERQEIGVIMRDRQLFFSGYRTVDEIYTKIDGISAQFPDLIEVFSYGWSYCKTVGGCQTPGGEQTAGHDLLAVRVTNESLPGSSTLTDEVVQRGNKPVFFMLANIHARELTTPELAMRWLNLLLEQYGHDPDITWLVDHQEMWIIPLANPDGHWIAELGEDPVYGGYPLMHRKNFDRDADKDGTADCSLWPSASYSHFGVDLNRNHSFGWLAPGNGTSACSPTYSGPSPASEPETAALQGLLRALFADRRGPQPGDQAAADTSGILLTLHNYGDLVLRPWGFDFTLSPDEHGLKAIGDSLASRNGYRSCRPPECLYTANGTTDDWAYGELGIPAYTFEIGTYEDGFSPPYGVIDQVQWPLNKGAFLQAALLARQPYQLIEGPDILQVEVSKNQKEETVTIAAGFQDPDQVAAAEFSIDVPFWNAAADPQPLAMRVSDPASGTATFEVQLDAAPLPAGEHMVFVRGRDAAGSTGITRAAYIDIHRPSLSQSFLPVAAGK
ncbi:MAG: M14 family zinc carboxypeptidase [Candidatus Promineifilaceae bacterium]